MLVTRCFSSAKESAAPKAIPLAFLPVSLYSPAEPWLQAISASLMAEEWFCQCLAMPGIELSEQLPCAWAAGLWEARLCLAPV